MGRFLRTVIRSCRCCGSTYDRFPTSTYSSVVCFFFFSSRRRHTRFDCDWSSDVCSSDLGTILPDPRDPNIVYSSGLGISQINYPTGEWINVGPDQDPSLKLRASLNLPIVFSTWHGQRELLAGYQYLMATRDGGVTWTKLGPDLSETRAHPAPSDTSIP